MVVTCRRIKLRKLAASAADALEGVDRHQSVGGEQLHCTCNLYMFCIYIAIKLLLLLLLFPFIFSPIKLSLSQHKFYHFPILFVG